MNLTEIKSKDGSVLTYYAAHRELAYNEQEYPCTCMIAAKKRLGTEMYPSLIEVEDLDPDCELHCPWVNEDPRTRMNAFRWWMAGYQVGFGTNDSITTAVEMLIDPAARGKTMDEAMEAMTDDQSWGDAEGCMRIFKYAAALQTIRAGTPGECLMTAIIWEVG